MEMAMETLGEMDGAVERLAAAAGALEQAAARLASFELQAAEVRVSEREAALEEQLAEAEATIVALKAAGSGRKTLAAGAGALMAKDGASIDVGALDQALSSLSLEQRIAVKAGLLRGGFAG